MIACALTYLLWALPGAAKNLPPSQSSNACSAGAHSEKPVESVPIQVGGVDDGAGFAVSIAELKQRTPRKARRAFRKGLNALRHSRTVEGERFLKEALTIDPHYFQAAAGLAALYFDLKRYPAARLYAELAHTIDPEYVPPLETLGALDVLEGQPARAITEFRMAERSSPLQWAAHYYLGVAFLQLGRCEEGSENLVTATELRDKPR